MTWTLSDYISQTLARFGSQLSPEIIHAMEDSYNSGLLGQIFDTAQTQSATISGATEAVSFSGPATEFNPAGDVLAQAYLSANPGSYTINQTDVGIYLNNESTFSAAINQINETLAAENLPALTQDQQYIITDPVWRLASTNFPVKQRSLSALS